MKVVTSLVIRSSHKNDRPRVFHRPWDPVAPAPQPRIIHYTNWLKSMRLNIDRDLVKQLTGQRTAPK